MTKRNSRFLSPSLRNSVQPLSSGLWCGLYCSYAEFAKADALDGARSCMTFQAVWCRRLKRYVVKNSKCAAGVKVQ